MSVFDISERLSCRLVGLSRSAFRRPLSVATSEDPDRALRAMEIPSTVQDFSNGLNSNAWVLLAAWGGLGFIIAWFSPRTQSLSQILFSAATFAGTVIGVWVLSTLDGGAFDRHAIPFSLLLPICAMMFTFSSFGFAIRFLRRRKFRIRRKHQSSEDIHDHFQS
jgi:hypothetical protein